MQHIYRGVEKEICILDCVNYEQHSSRLHDKGLSLLFGGFPSQ